MFPAISRLISKPGSSARSERIIWTRAVSLKCRCSEIRKSSFVRRASTPPSGGDLSELAWVMPLRVMAICAHISLLTVEESLELRVWAGAFPPFMNWPGFHSVTSRLISRQRADTPQDDEPQYSKPEDRPRVTIRRPEICLRGMFLRPSSR